MTHRSCPIMMFLMVLVFGFVSQLNAESENSVIGCITGNQAKTLNAAINGMLEATPFVELMKTLSKNVEEAAMNRLEKCFEKEKVLHKMSCMVLENFGGDGSAVMKQFEQYKKSQKVGFQNAYDTVLNPLIQSAQRIESKITEGNERRLIQMHISSSFKDIWLTIRRIRQEHEKTLQSMDVFLQDALVQKVASISCYVRKGNAGNKYSYKSVKSDLRRTDEVINVDKLIFLYYKVLAKTDLIYQHNEYLRNYIIGQAAFAIHNTKLERSLTFDSDDRDEAERYESFSELKTSSAIRETAKLIRDGLAVGYDEAKTYSTSVNTTLDSFKEGFGGFDSISINQNCAKVRDLTILSASMYVSTFQMLQELGLSKLASEYRDKVQNFYTDNILTAMNTYSVQPAIKLILQSLPPQYAGSMNPNVRKIDDFLNKFVATPIGGSDINSFNVTLGKVSIHLQKLLDGFRCYRKIFQVMGNIIQGCKDGRKGFEDLYNEHSTKADLASTKCTEMALMETPTKEQIQQIVNAAAKEFNFNANCQQNQQSDDPGYIYDDGLNYEDEGDDTGRQSRLSTSQRFMVCDLRKKYSKPNSEIAGMIKRDISMINAVRCMSKQA